MEERHLKLVHSKDSFDPKIQRALDNIFGCIIDIVVGHKGEVSLQRVESITGLKKIGKTITADMIRYMVKEGIVELRGNTIRGNIAKLTEILEQYKTNLPEKHGKPWSEDEYVQLAEMKLNKKDTAFIVSKLERTGKSVSMQMSLLRKAFRLIPIIERHKSVRDFVSVPASPNPKE